MKHPVEADLALFAGHDLGFISEWRIKRHVSRCEQCHATVESYEALQAETSKLAELPSNIAWNRLASEMKANIRLGLAAGECVAGNPAFSERSKRSTFSGFQTLLAYASVVALVVAGLWLQRSAPQSVADSPEVNGSVLAATRDGVEFSEGKGSFGLRYGASRDVNYSAGAKGVMRARYVDASTGYVTVVSVNVE
jgi:hypothetical protein